MQYNQKKIQGLVQATERRKEKARKTIMDVQNKKDKIDIALLIHHAMSRNDIQGLIASRDLIAEEERKFPGSEESKDHISHYKDKCL